MDSFIPLFMTLEVVLSENNFSCASFTEIDTCHHREIYFSAGFFQAVVFGQKIVHGRLSHVAL